MLHPVQGASCVAENSCSGLPQQACNQDADCPGSELCCNPPIFPGALDIGVCAQACTL